MSEAIVLYVVYNNTSDYPGKYVVRRWYGNIPEDELFCEGDSLEEVILKLPHGLLRVFAIDDDPCIEAVFL